jgi:anaerobic ribonucleoside-triphosphate reductase activating protein
MSRDTWNPSAGTSVSVADLESRWRRAATDGADGLTVSGGEPLNQPTAVADLLRRVRRADPEADILLYTGYELDELDADQLVAVSLADALIVGRYLAARPTRLLWRGSANQRLIMQTSLGRARYAAYESVTVERTPMQAAVDDSGHLLVIGVPPPGALGRLERALRERGIHAHGRIRPL